MRTANFRDDLLFGVAALLSITPNPDLSPEFAAQWCQYVNTRIKYAWSYYDFPELMVTQERAFRPIWRVDQDWFTGDEVCYLPYLLTPPADNNCYFRALSEIPQSASNSPTNATYWEPITALDRYIAYDQLGQQSIGEVYGVYNANPRLTAPAGIPAIGFRPSERGIDVSSFSGNSVYVWYQIPPSKFTTVPWANGLYFHGDKVYWTDGNCYQCAVQSTTHDPTDVTSWFMIPLPSTLLDYVKTAVAGDAADDARVEAGLLREADEYLNREIDKLMGQGHVYRYRLSNRRSRYLGYGLSNFWWSAFAPWQGSFVSTLTDTYYSPIPQDRRPSLFTDTGESIVTDQLENILAV